MSNIDDYVDRLEANLKTRHTLRTPFGKVRLGTSEVVTTRRHRYDRKANCERWFPFHYVHEFDCPLVAGFAAARGLLFKQETAIVLEVARNGGLVEEEVAWRRRNLERTLGATVRRIGDCVGMEIVTVFHHDSEPFPECVRYVRNDPPGSGFAHENLHVVLAGPAHTDLVMGAQDKLAQSLRWVFRGRTDAEDEVLVRRHLEDALAGDNVAVVRRVARAAGVEADFVLRLAREMAAKSAELRLEDVDEAGPVLRQRGG